jgi:hypothetical protein
MSSVRRLLPVLLALTAGCGGGATSTAKPAVSAPPVQDGRARPRLPQLVPARCPAGVTGCRAVTGRIVFVQRVDPDGDGDLHVVVAAGGVSLPGFTSFDVRKGLRPPTDPVIGDLATAAGPVQRGSFGQNQIHALVFRVRAGIRLHPRR